MVIRTEKQRKNISIGTRKAMNKPEVKKKLKKLKTKEHKKKLRIASYSTASVANAFPFRKR